MEDSYICRKSKNELGNPRIDCQVCLHHGESARGLKFSVESINQHQILHDECCFRGSLVNGGMEEGLVSALQDRLLGCTEGFMCPVQLCNCMYKPAFRRFYPKYADLVKHCRVDHGLDEDGLREYGLGRKRRKLIGIQRLQEAEETRSFDLQLELERLNTENNQLKKKVATLEARLQLLESPAVASAAAAS